MTLHATTIRTYVAALGREFHIVECACGWHCTLVDRIDAERHAARHVALNARGEGR